MYSINNLEKFLTALYCYRITQCVINMKHNIITIGDNYGDRYQVDLDTLADKDRKQVDYYMAEFGEYEEE